VHLQIAALRSILFGLVRRDCAQHAAYLSLDGPQPSLAFDNQEGTPHPRATNETEPDWPLAAPLQILNEHHVQAPFCP
jgi:hypothetical protein